MDTQANNSRSKQIITGGAIAALLALAGPAIEKFEGVSTVPYKDTVGVLTVCYGETNVKMKKYSIAECKSLLNGRAEEFGRAVAKRNPELVGHPYQWAAATSLAYNIGTGNYTRSTVAKNFSAGKWKEACSHFTDWSYAGGKLSQGLLNRRLSEQRMCLQQLP